MCFSRILPTMGSREIGRKKRTSSLAELLGIGMIFDNFQSAGRPPVAIERLKIDERDGAII